MIKPSNSQLRRAMLAALAGALLLPAADAAAAKPARCDKTKGTELAHSAVVKVYKVKSGPSYRYFGCAKPRGPVVALTKPFQGRDVKLVAAKGAYVAFTRTISGRDTIAVVDARTGKKRHGLYPPDEIEFDVDPSTPQIGAARVNARGELVVSYIGLGDGSSTDSTVFIYAFDLDYHDQLLDNGTSSKLRAKSIKLSGRTVSWTHARRHAHGEDRRVRAERHLRRRPDGRRRDHVAGGRHRLPRRAGRPERHVHRVLRAQRLRDRHGEGSGERDRHDQRRLLGRARARRRAGVERRHLQGDDEPREVREGHLQLSQATGGAVSASGSGRAGP